MVCPLASACRLHQPASPQKQCQVLCFQPSRVFKCDSQIIDSSQALCERLQPWRPPQVPMLCPGFPHGLGVFQLGTVMRCRDTSWHILTHRDTSWHLSSSLHKSPGRGLRACRINSSQHLSTSVNINTEQTEVQSPWSPRPRVVHLPTSVWSISGSRPQKDRGCLNG